MAPCHVRLSLVLSLLGLTPGAAQLRPRRVGTSALGEQMEAEMVEPMAAQQSLDDLGAGLGGGDPAEMMKKMMEGMGNLDNLADNPLMKSLAEANPEVAKMLSDPEALKEQMAEMAKVMQSPEGQQMASKMMEEMQSVLTDPDKLAEGLQQLSTNPALKGLADSVPGLKEVLDDPAAMREQVEKTAEMFQSMGDPSKLAEMMGDLQNMEGMQELQDSLKQMLQGEGGADAMSNMLQGLMGGEGEGEEGDDLQARVRQNLARMMQQHAGGGNDELIADNLDEF